MEYVALFATLGFSGVICVPSFGKKHFAAIKGSTLSFVITSIIMYLLGLGGILFQEAEDSFNLKYFFAVWIIGNIVVGLICSRVASRYRRRHKEKMLRLKQAETQIDLLEKEILTHQNNMIDSIIRETGFEAQAKTVETNLALVMPYCSAFTIINDNCEFIGETMISSLRSALADFNSSAKREREFQREEKTEMEKCNQCISSQKIIIAREGEVNK